MVMAVENEQQEQQQFAIFIYISVSMYYILSIHHFLRFYFEDKITIFL